MESLLSFVNGILIYFKTKMFNNKTILITGGTGSFGNACTKHLLKNYNCKKIIIFSRDEMKQYEMKTRFNKYKNIRYFLGDVRDLDRLKLAFKGVDFVITLQH